MTSCFAPLLRWIVQSLVGSESQLALALDATSLGDRWTVLAVSVLVRSCAIPIAWKVLPADAKGSWGPHWESLLNQLAGSVPADWLVIGLADRGRSARWLSQAMVRCGWHPFLRITLGVKVRPVGAGAASFEWLSRWRPAPGGSWQGAVDCFVQKKSRLRCPLLLHWEADYADPWAVITALPVEQAQVAWYAGRAWIEAGFKDLKRGGWGWPHRKMQAASRVERVWLAMAVALVWTVRLGSQADSQLVGGDLEQLPARHIARQRVKRQPSQRPARRLRCPQRGRLVLLAALVRAEDLPLGALVAEPWPQRLTPPKPRARPTTGRQKARRQAHKRRSKAARKRKRAAWFLTPQKPWLVRFPPRLLPGHP